MILKTSARKTAPPIQLKKVRELTTGQSTQPGRPSHVSAASGLVRRDHKIYVVADDELSLGVFDLNHSDANLLFPLLPGQLPLDHRARKREKPDWEALLQINSHQLLAVPSGSTSRRNQGVVVSLDTQGLPNAKTQLVNFDPFYLALSKEFNELNIEGCVLTKKHLIFFQRGNGALHENAVITLDSKRSLQEIAEGLISATSIESIKRYHLGTLDNIPLSFTDATCMPDETLLFVAASEDTNSTYEDGACTGSVLGAIDADGQLAWMQPLLPRIKAEGLCAAQSNDELLLVTDGDNPEEPAELFSCRLMM